MFEIGNKATNMATTEGIERWDLTARVSPFLDRHMMFPLLEYLDSLIGSGKISYASKDVAAARLSLLRPTHMVDYAIDIYKTLHGEKAEIPKEMEEQKAKVYERLEELRSGCSSLDELCRKEDERVSCFREDSKTICLTSCELNLVPLYTGKVEGIRTMERVSPRPNDGSQGHSGCSRVLSSVGQVQFRLW